MSFVSLVRSSLITGTFLVDCIAYNGISEYIDKFEFYQQRVFQCSLTKKKGLTFEEALTSEHAIKQKSHDVQDCYLRVICEQTHCSTYSLVSSVCH